jgi:phosphoglycolate phosphatase/putative hydrolase of the HAD superfamily
MRVVSLPSKPGAFIFDIDGTLYTNQVYIDFQESVLVERLARERGEKPEATGALLGRMREDRAAAGLGRTSLGMLFAELGVGIETSVRWRIELIDPREWLKADLRLDDTLAELASRCALAAVTNNPRSVGEKGLEALGVRSRFRAVVGLDDTMASKPAPEPFLLAAGLLGVPPERCVSVGDRREVDLDPALALGMGAILVDGVADVYTLPALLDP